MISSKKTLTIGPGDLNNYQKISRIPGFGTYRLSAEVTLITGSEAVICTKIDKPRLNLHNLGGPRSQAGVNVIFVSGDGLTFRFSPYGFFYEE
jgi:hypothetical protein